MSGGEINRRRLLDAGGMLCAISILGLSTGSAPAWAQPADARVRAFYAALLDTMQRGPQLGMKGRYDRLAPVIRETFDVAGMMRVAAGPGWSKATPAQQAAMIDAFVHMMTAIYAGRFSSFTGEKLEVLGTTEQPPSDRLVKTRIVPPTGDVADLTYLMRSTPEGWKVADVFLDGSISELAVRRVEFSGIMKSGGPDALVAALRKKGDQILAGR